MSTGKARILLVDDHQIVLESLSLLLTSFDQIAVVGKFTDGRAAMEYFKDNGADLIITDMRMPILNGVEVCVEARKIDPAAKILMLTMVEDAKQIREAIKIGVNGYVLKMADADELFLAIRTIMDGRKYFSNEVIIELAVGKDIDPTSKPGTFAKLTLRELEILRLVGQEMSTNEIAEKLFISVPTVETHRRNLMQKIGAKSVVGLVLFAVKHDLLA
ncbi:response regulator [Dyadobacter psychrotolerans]|uniref:Response regulator transcription factor n=1 Tax=Dyadobacter psychrotolerans TaxID=2541721 RepID=A0A4R5DSV4_9BACT|nr:response regulator transcription factor [Dyadobacter psychrotolerans]TDE17522.1 response regulator transcription factor [Dyadobacter psychrotolerans]